MTECGTPATAWLWCDDFETDRLDSYFEYNSAGGSFSPVDSVGLGGSVGMQMSWSPGQVDGGWLHLAVGRSPDAYRHSVSSTGTDFRTLYWRLFVRNEPRWIGGGGHKLSRATVFHSPENWGQAMAAHVWSEGESHSALAVDPASGTDEEGNVLTSKFNDFGNLRWLGLEVSRTPIFDSAHVGRWYCIELEVGLNTVGSSDGTFRLWIDGALEAERDDLNWVGAYSDYGINAVFLENYWNEGAPQAQSRYFDNFVVSTEPIGCG